MGLCQLLFVPVFAKTPFYVKTFSTDQDNIEACFCFHNVNVRKTVKHEQKNKIQKYKTKGSTTTPSNRSLTSAHTKKNRKSN